MSRVLTALLALALAGCGEQRPPRAVAWVSGSRHDFGPLWIGETRQATFTIRNDGGKELILDPVRSSCGCLVAKLAKNRLAPGESTEMVAELHADKGPAALDKRISIHTNDPAVEWLGFQLLTETRELYVHQPLLIDLQELVLGDPVALAVPFEVADGTAVRFGTPESPEASFAATLQEVAPTRAVLALAFDGKGPSRRRLFHVVVPTDHPRVAAARFAVQAIVKPRLLSIPENLLDFGTVARTVGGVREVVIRSRSKEPLAVAPTVGVDTSLLRRSDAVGLPDVTAELQETVAGREWKLIARVAPGGSGAALVGRVVVRLALPDEPPLSLTLAGRLVD